MNSTGITKLIPLGMNDFRLRRIQCVIYYSTSVIFGILIIAHRLLFLCLQITVMSTVIDPFRFWSFAVTIDIYVNCICEISETNTIKTSSALRKIYSIFCWIVKHRQSNLGANQKFCGFLCFSIETLSLCTMVNYLSMAEWKQKWNRGK